MADAGNEKLTPLEREIIEAANVDVSNPPDLSNTALGKELSSQYTKARVRTDREETETAAQPQVVDLNNLDPEKKAEVMAAIAAASKQEQVEEEAAKKNADMPEYIKNNPGLAAAYALTNENENEQPVIVDDLDDDDDDKEEAESDSVTEAAVEKEAKPDAAAGGLLVKENCPRCNHKLDQPVISVSDDDKHVFIASTIGGTRFTKEYAFFNKNIRVVFRELTPSEANFALRQLDIDAKNGVVIGEYDYFRKLVEYRLVMSVLLFHRQGQAPIEFEEVSTLKYDKTKNETPIPGLLEFMDNDVFVTEHVRRTIGVNFMRFQRLVEMMEARAEDVDFFTKTE